MKNIIVRALSGAVYVALIVCSMLFCGSWGFPLLCCLFIAIGIVEFQKMTGVDFHSSPRTLLVDILIGISLPLTVMSLYGFDIVMAVTMFAVAVTLCLMRLVMQLYSHQPDTLRRVQVSLTSIAYVAVPLAMACALGLTFGWPLLLLVFVMIWLNDTGAFLVGSAIGSHRLFPRLSPKKSWEGFFGGMLFAIAAGVVAAEVPAISRYFYGYNAWALAGLGLLVSLMATWGDLFESMIKRQAGVKDSGHLIPGHGGILDRIDSLLFVAPASLVYLSISYFFLNMFMLIQGA